MKTEHKLKRDFLQNLQSPVQFSMLFDHIPDLYFFVKNRDCRFITSNKMFYHQCGVESEEEIIGKTDYDFFPADRAKKYESDDTHVMNTGESIINQIELGPEPDGTINWFVVSKVPLYSIDGKIAGVAGAARDMRKANHELRPYNELADVIDFINSNYSSNICTKDLAERASLSVSHFERKFKKTFKTSPAKYIMKVRIKASCAALARNNDTISTIAQNCGFYDHAHFTKQFSREMGITPKQYRKQH